MTVVDLSEPGKVAHRDRFHQLAVRRVVRETADAVSIVFDVPADLQAHYAYHAGQFVTLRVVVDGTTHLRSYSMSSAPETDEELQVTVKRVPDGAVSAQLLDSLSAGDLLEVSEPAGAFRLSESGEDLVAFAAGSGITPIFSMVKSALHATDRSVRLLYANRDRESAIFAGQLEELEREFPQRLVIQHHLDEESGFVAERTIEGFATDHEGPFYVCGPTAFMEVVQAGLARLGVAPEQVRLERFTPAPLPVMPPFAVAAADADDDGPTITITVGSETKTLKQRDKLTILESARWNGMAAPSSCEAGHCATCMALVVEGEVSMRVNDVLTDDEVEEGWVLTCQAVPVSPVVRVVYET